MKRIFFLATTFIMMLNANVSFAQTDAGNFYKSTSVHIKKVSFSKMAEHGFVTLSLDLSYWCESEGEPRK